MQQLSRTGKSVIRLSFLAGRGDPQAIAFIYRDRLIWSCRFRQRQLRCTQRNSSCKVSYEYVELADFLYVIVYLWRSIISTGSILSLSLFAFVFSSGSKALSVKDQSMGTQRRTWHNFLLVHVTVCFCTHFLCKPTLA